MGKTVIVQGSDGTTAIIKKRKKTDKQPTVVIKYRGVGTRRRKAKR